MYGRLETIQFIIGHQSSPNLLGKAGAKGQTCLHLLASRSKTHQVMVKIIAPYLVVRTGCPNKF